MYMPLKGDMYYGDMLRQLELEEKALDNQPVRLALLSSGWARNSPNPPQHKATLHLFYHEASDETVICS
jgi:hypothetical protein